jgi:hypothetical protein
MAVSHPLHVIYLVRSLRIHPVNKSDKQNSHCTQWTQETSADLATTTIPVGVWGGTGTVLSTNWKDIGAKKTEIKPPTGMEHKKY